MNAKTKKLIISSLLVLASMLIYNYLAAKQLEGLVVSVQDGDTVTVLKGQSTFKIRLDGIDCPEKGQAFGSVARQFTADQVFQKQVRVRYTRKDRYQRYLGTVYTTGGKNLNQELLKAGLAWQYKDNDSPILAALEMKARREKKGLWADRDPIAPWDFRRGQREKP